MNHILSNLLSNAGQYLVPGKPGKVEIYGEEDELKTTFHIRDNGQGIAESEMHKLFQPFRQIGEREFEGVGMGLAFVQTLVRRHGGRVWCESEEGVGSIFSTFVVNSRQNGSWMSLLGGIYLYPEKLSTNTFVMSVDAVAGLQTAPRFRIYLRTWRFI